jgi:hypothetical protein
MRKLQQQVVKELRLQLRVKELLQLMILNQPSVKLGLTYLALANQVLKLLSREYFYKHVLQSTRPHMKMEPSKKLNKQNSTMSSKKPNPTFILS